MFYLPLPKMTKQLIENIIAEYKEEPAYYNSADWLRALLEKHLLPQEQETQDSIYSIYVRMSKRPLFWMLLTTLWLILFIAFDSYIFHILTITCFFNFIKYDIVEAVKDALLPNTTKDE